MNDWELFEAMSDAEKRFEELKAEFRGRGLHNKPFVEWKESGYCNCPAQHSYMTFMAHDATCPQSYVCDCNTAQGFHEASCAISIYRASLE